MLDNANLRDERIKRLASINFGERVAEDEIDNLQKYFIETEQWQQLLNGKIDIVKGAKGSGKSALYLLLDKHREKLLQSSIHLIAGENVRGATAFRDISSDPPIDEVRFVALWKTYFLQLICKYAIAAGIRNDRLNIVVEKLRDAELLPESNALKALLRRAADFIDRALRAKSIEPSVTMEATGIPTFSSKLNLGETPEKSIQNIDDMLDECDAALREIGITLWLMFDRLDVAFSETPDIEKNALRALFKAYGDLRGLDNINLKIFIRDDIWDRIFETGFREASHLTKTTTIRWNKNLIVNMISKRILNTQDFLDLFDVDPQAAAANIQLQEEVFYLLFPQKVDTGPNKPTTIDWVIRRTQDGLGRISPREIIHLLSEAKKIETSKAETGDSPPYIKPLINSSSLKEGLVEVSRYRLNNTLLAEYPSLKPYLDALRNGKTRYSLDSLKKVLGTSDAETPSIAKQLVEVGFFEKQNNKGGDDYWMPFLYRDALEVTQGTAEAEGE